MFLLMEKNVHAQIRSWTKMFMHKYVHGQKYSWTNQIIATDTIYYIKQSKIFLPWFCMTGSWFYWLNGKILSLLNYFSNLTHSSWVDFFLRGNFRNTTSISKWQLQQKCGSSMRCPWALQAEQLKSFFLFLSVSLRYYPDAADTSA